MLFGGDVGGESDFVLMNNCVLCDHVVNAISRFCVLISLIVFIILLTLYLHGALLRAGFFMYIAERHTDNVAVSNMHIL